MRWQEMDGWIAARTTSEQSIVLLTSNHRCIASPVCRQRSTTDNRIGNTLTTSPYAIEPQAGVTKARRIQPTGRSGLTAS